ncbi:DUF202 domain-containing protein [Nocardioides insulae]|uniref:DUF202 domain-containing protein n=1 Tax=Nocardioides insulae TaxID=394734 RepID=UPI00049140FE|nr:DUF202 domain-containing protein [Nocardioides insulae]
MSRNSRRGPIDMGLQLERTTLAWRRTTLTTVVAAAAAARLLATDHPAWQATAVGLALLTAGLAEYATARRFHLAGIAMAHHVDRERGPIEEGAGDGPPPRLPAGGTLAVVSAGQALAGVLTAILLLVN